MFAATQARISDHEKSLCYNWSWAIADAEPFAGGNYESKWKGYEMGSQFHMKDAKNQVLYATLLCHRINVN